MKMTVVPAQVTTVEDRIIGSLGFSQILLLIVPVFFSAATFALLPPFMGSAVYKYVAMGAVAILFCILAIRIKDKIVAFWLVTILRYSLRPKYYLFNKNVTTFRERYPIKKETQESDEIDTVKTVRKVTRNQLDIPATARVLAAIEDPATRLRFETGKKGGLHARLTQIKDKD